MYESTSNQDPDTIYSKKQTQNSYYQGADRIQALEWELAQIKNRLASFSSYERLPNNGISETIIYKEGSTYKAKNGSTGKIAYSGTSAHTVIQNAIDNIGGKISVISDIVLTSGITGKDNVTLDFNRKTITPATSINIMHMKPGFQIQNAIFDVSDLTFTHACIHFSSTEDWSQNENDLVKVNAVWNCDGISASQKGIFVYMDGTSESSGIQNVRVVDCSTKDFEYAYKFVNCATTWINGNWFERIDGIADKYFIYMDASAGAEMNRNYFSFQYQEQDETVCCITCDGKYNIFRGNPMDCNDNGEAITFAATSEKNLLITGGIPLNTITDNGTNNMIFSLSNIGFIGKGDFRLFELTNSNPILAVYGDVSGTEKYGTLSVAASGKFTIGAGTTSGLNISNVAGETLLANEAAGNVELFRGCETGENRLIRIYGRNAGDTDRDYVSIRWGSGTHDDGEIITSEGLLRLSPTGKGIVINAIKTDTGDPSSPVEGQMYINTFDNKIRVYADGGWRDLATW